MKQEMMRLQWHQLDHMQIICTSLQTDNHASISSLIFTDRLHFLTPKQHRQSSEGKPIVGNDSTVIISTVYVGGNLLEKKQSRGNTHVRPFSG